MAEFNLEKIIKSSVDKALNKPIVDGKSITEWAAIGMKAPRWISVNEKLPDEEKEYVCWFGDYPLGAFAKICRWNKNEGEFWCYTDNKKWGFITHWMFLPEVPKED